MVAGFVHGVLDTDNMKVTGESFDYGPWRFLPRYDPMFTAAYFDHSGLYAFGRQPEAAAWNLTRLAEALDGVTRAATLVEDLRAGFHEWLEAAVVEGVLRRLGLRSRGRVSDAELVDGLYVFLARSRVGYDQAFFDLHGGPASAARWAASPEAAAYEHESFAELRARLKATGPPSAQRGPWSPSRTFGASAPSPCRSKRWRRCGRRSPSATTGPRSRPRSRRCGRPDPGPSPKQDLRNGRAGRFRRKFRRAVIGWLARRLRDATLIE